MKTPWASLRTCHSGQDYRAASKLEYHSYSVPPRGPAHCCVWCIYTCMCVRACMRMCVRCMRMCVHVYAQACYRLLAKCRIKRQPPLSYEGTNLLGSDGVSIVCCCPRFNLWSKVSADGSDVDETRRQFASTYFVYSLDSHMMVSWGT